MSKKIDKMVDLYEGANNNERGIIRSIIYRDRYEVKNYRVIEKKGKKRSKKRSRRY